MFYVSHTIYTMVQPSYIHKSARRGRAHEYTAMHALALFSCICIILNDIGNPLLAK